MIWVITLANKPALLLEALASVARQTRRDYRHVVQLDGGGWPPATYPPAVYWNTHAPAAAMDDYCVWLSDDDVWLDNYLETLAGFLDAHPEVGACYGGTRLVAYDPATGRQWTAARSDGITEIPATVEFNSEHLPSCRIDGGQVLIRRRVLEDLEPPWMSESLMNCNISDGTLLNRIAMLTPIVPVVGSWVMVNRMTPESSHWRLIGDTPQFASADTVRRLLGQ